MDGTGPRKQDDLRGSIPSTAFPIARRCILDYFGAQARHREIRRPEEWAGKILWALNLGRRRPPFPWTVPGTVRTKALELVSQALEEERR